MEQISAKNDFINMIKKDIAFQRWEQERQSRILNLILTEIALFLFLYAGFYLILYIFGSNMNPLLFRVSSVGFGIIYLIAFICFCGNPFWYNKDFKEELKKSYKKKLKYFFTITGFGKNGFDKGTLQLSNLFSNFEKIEYDDCFKGTYKDVKFMVAETALIDIHNYGKDKPEFTVFKGVIISIDFNKNINSDTIVRTKGDISFCNKPNVEGLLLIAFAVICFYILPFIISDLEYWLSHPFVMLSIALFPLLVLSVIFLFVFTQKNNFFLDNNFKTISLEDVKFARKYKVLSKDEIEARYLVTTAFMERLQNLQTAFGTKNIKCSFFKDKIMFAISTNKDLFELGSLWRPFGKDIEDFYNQITSIYEIIDHFKLNERTGL